VQVPDADGRGASLSVTGYARGGLAAAGLGGLGAGRVSRVGRVGGGAVPGAVVARAGLAAGVAGSPARGRVGVPRVGLVFPDRLPFEVWAGVGAQLAAAAAASAWCLGDWLAYGQAAYGGRYREAVGRTGLEYQTLRNYAWVAGRFELSRRRDTLSFGHHAEVAALPAPEQDFWLRKAEQFGWPVMRLRREVRASLAERGQEPSALEPAGPAGCSQHRQRAGRPVAVRVALTAGQFGLCEQAAAQDGMTVGAWAARALEQAARGSLQHPHHPRPEADSLDEQEGITGMR
jgi:hypothetical protein